MPAHIPDRVSFQIRLNETVHAKIKIIANRESRNLNSQCEYFLKKSVERYEEEHGPIDVQQE